MEAAEKKNQVEKFLSLLFEPTDLVEMRLLPAGRKIFHVAREWPEHLSELHAANERGGQDIYIGVNPRIREGGKTEDVALARCLCADWDDVEPDDAGAWITARGLPAPTLILHSGHGVHAYWRLIQPIADVDTAWRAAQVAIATGTGGDRKCQDPPRVMRLPGFLNLPDKRKGETDPIPARILFINAEAVYHLEDVAGVVEAPPSNSALMPTAPMPSASLDRYNRLSRATLQFCFSGAFEGERQTRCFHAACDMAGNGFSQAEVESRLLPAAMACQLPESEARQSIRSAFSRARAPAVPAGMHDNDAVGSAFQHSGDAAVAVTETVASPHVVSQPVDVPAPAPASQTTAMPAAAKAPTPAASPSIARLQISNVIDTSYKDAEGNDVPCRYHIPLPQIAAAIAEATDGWPRRAGGMLFSINPKTDSLPDHHWIQWIGDCDDLFAWMGRTCDVRWAGGDALHHQTKKKLNPPTKREMFAYLKDNASPSYRAVEVLPHHPLIHDLYYVPCIPPQVQLPQDGSATPLQQLVNRFNPETENDRTLMLAALLTPGWGGPPGSRPAFVFTSEHGRGVGKTATATVLAEIWGGSISIGAREDWDKVRGRLLGDESLAKRVVVIDNVKGKFQGGDIEGLITAPVIDGWKPYFGQASRPNLLTWYITANAPSLSRDIADRSVIVKIGPQQHASDFIRWAVDHIRQHRAEIIAELIDILQGQALCAIENTNRDRWGAWQDAVLTRFEDGNELARLIIDRRPAVDSDLEDAAEIAQAVRELVEAKLPMTHDAMVVRITRKQLQDRLVAAGIVDRGLHPKGVTSFIKDKLNTGPLTFLKYGQKKVDGETDRYWFYVGPKASGEEEPCELPE